jgi:pimeloyl-ACP methyl ester carboxylesterase
MAARAKEPEPQPEVPFRRGRGFRRCVTPTVVDAVPIDLHPVDGLFGEVQYFELAPDLLIAYEIHGTAGPPVILLHGFGASRESWCDILPCLAPHMRLYLVDLLGFGLSSKPRNADYSVAMQATIVAKLISALA